MVKLIILGVLLFVTIVLFWLDSKEYHGSYISLPSGYLYGWR